MATKGERKYIGRIGDSADAWIDATLDFASENPAACGIFWNKQEPLGLRLYIGKRAATWQYFSQRRDHGDRAHTFVTLGKYDRGARGSVVGGGAAMPAGKQSSSVQSSGCVSGTRTDSAAGAVAHGL